MDLLDGNGQESPFYFYIMAYLSKNKGFFFRKKDVTKYIARLDVKTQHQEIAALLGTHEFPWDTTRALEVALLRTFASPSVSGLLHKTKEFSKYGQKRYDDTALLIAEFVEHGYDSPRGKRAIEHMNWIHSHYDIPNEDFLFVLSTFILDPIDWIQRFGWRKMTDKEEEAMFLFFREVGVRMKLENIPDTLTEMKAFSEGYAHRHFVYADSNRKVADSTMKIVENWLPYGFRWLVSPTLRAILDDDLLRVFGYKRPSILWCGLVRGALVFRGRVLRWIDLYRKPYLTTERWNRTYPNGYEIEKIGPKKLFRERD